MSWKRLHKIAGILLTVGVVSGCGGAGLIDPGSDAGPSIPTATTTADPTGSAAYCQLLADGEWVTNDSANSTTPCVPEPSYATGDEQADSSVALPRCYACKLSDWDRAETLAAVRNGRATPASPVATTAAGATGHSTWSPDDRRNFISGCTGSLGGSLCECLANHLESQVPSDQEQGISGEDPRVQVAARNCRS